MGNEQQSEFNTLRSNTFLQLVSIEKIIIFRLCTSICLI